MKISEIDRLLSQGSPITIAIDGKCGAGKTTLAALLSREYDCNVLHMDSFFLPLHMRTDERLKTPGGNVHYERFSREVMEPLLQNAVFSYRIFDCKTMDYKRERVHVSPKPLTVVEGSYSTHPELVRLYSLKIFLDIDEELQKRRIIERNGAQGYKAFAEKWIPMENLYFAAFGIKEKSDIVYHAGVNALSNTRGASVVLAKKRKSSKK